jgi:RNase P protein component
MKVANYYRVVRYQDHIVPKITSRSLIGPKGMLDIRIWYCGAEFKPILLVNASRRQGRAVQRNLFRRRVRMAFLKILQEQLLISSSPYTIWVRPIRTVTNVGIISFQEIEAKIRLALSRWEI